MTDDIGPNVFLKEFTDDEFIAEMQTLKFEEEEGGYWVAMSDLDRLIALASIGAAVQPRPISEAPKDGTLIDIFLSFILHDGTIDSNADGRFPDCCWDEQSASWEGDDMRHYETFDVLELKPGEAGLIVTHWMPRPLFPLSALPQPKVKP